MITMGCDCQDRKKVFKNNITDPLAMLQEVAAFENHELKSQHHQAGMLRPLSKTFNGTL